MPIPLSKVMTVLAPIIATLAATAADWLVVHVHLFAVMHVTEKPLASAIVQATVWGITALGTYLIQHGLIQDVLVSERNARARERAAKEEIV